MSLFDPVLSQKCFSQNRSTVLLDLIDLIDPNCILEEYLRCTVRINSSKSKYFLTVKFRIPNLMFQPNQMIHKVFFFKYMVSINSYGSRCLTTMNTIPMIHVDSSDPTSMSETNSISPSIKSGSLFDDTLQFLGWIIHIVLGFVMLNASSCLPSLHGLGGPPFAERSIPYCKLLTKLSFLFQVVSALQAPQRSIPSCKDSTKLSFSFQVVPAIQAPQVLGYY